MAMSETSHNVLTVHQRMFSGSAKQELVFRSAQVGCLRRQKTLADIASHLVKSASAANLIALSVFLTQPSLRCFTGSASTNALLATCQWTETFARSVLHHVLSAQRHLLTAKLVMVVVGLSLCIKTGVGQLVQTVRVLTPTT